MSKTPSIPRPLEGDIDQGYKLEIGATVTFIAAAIVVGLRFLARILYARLGWDDYLMLFAVVCAPQAMRRKECYCSLRAACELSAEFIYSLGSSTRRNDNRLCCNPLGPWSAHLFPKPRAASQAAVLFDACASLLHSRSDLCKN